MAHVYDVLILGGGPAGLAMATTLARQAYSALVIDSGAYRNARAAHMHNVPGFDHVPPADFRAKVRADLAARYRSVAFQDDTTIVEVRRRDGADVADATAGPPGTGDGDGTEQVVPNATEASAGTLADARFEARDARGNVYYGRKLGLATGVRDKLEEQVEGYGDCWGRGIFHCLFCDGFEERGASSVGVLGVGLLSSADALAHVSLLAKRLAAHATIYTDGDAGLAAALRPSRLSGGKVTVETRRVARLALRDWPASSAVVVTLADGTTREEGFVASHPALALAAPGLARQLGLETRDEAGGPGPLVVVRAPTTGETSVAGCFAAGDAVVSVKSVVQALQTGQMAGAGMAMQLMQELEARDEL
ncbi:hypothetical protein V2A60_005539 [Cordyceps javanica]